MANEENLTHKLTVSEQRAGGKKSGAARRKKREIREMLEEYLAMPAKVNGRMRAVSKRRTRWGLGRRTYKGAQREGGRPLTGTSGSTRA